MATVAVVRRAKDGTVLLAVQSISAGRSESGQRAKERGRGLKNKKSSAGLEELDFHTRNREPEPAIAWSPR